MDYETFRNKVITGLLYISKDGTVSYGYREGIVRNNNGIIKIHKYPDDTELVVASRESGGMTGGSCWGDKPHYYSASGSESVESDTFERVMELVVPDITFLGYRKILRSLHTDSITIYGYYGNYTEYTITYCSLQELYELIKDEIKE